MKESIGYTVSLNIMIIFITIIVAFLCAALIYFKSNKASNIITSAIEKYEGYNTNSISEINRNLSSLGYGSRTISCAASVDGDDGSPCSITGESSGTGGRGYCVYECNEMNADGDVEYYYYKIRTNMMITIPIIQDILDIPVYSNTNRLYNFN